MIIPECSIEVFIFRKLLKVIIECYNINDSGEYISRTDYYKIVCYNVYIVE